MYIFMCIAYIYVFIKYNSLKSNVFFNPILFPCFSGSRFFRVRVWGLEVLEVAVFRCSSKLVLLKISKYSQENTCVGLSPCENCKTFKNTFFTEHLWTTAFEPSLSD